ncbi:MAG: phosphopantetheine-binding protein [Acutalibacteraceae bacterium]|nr:phosphopantetheine-binding protein [Acutalibacteraceae bacterium]
MIETLKELLAEYVGETEVEITESTDLKNDLGLNSLELAELACAVEDEFDIEIPNKAIHTIVTVGDVIRYVEENA